MIKVMMALITTKEFVRTRECKEKETQTERCCNVVFCSLGAVMWKGFEKKCFNIQE